MRSPRLSSTAMLVAGLALLATPSIPCQGQDRAERSAPNPLFGRNLDAVRRASVEWERRAGPTRQVVDQVCLVPDLPTFLDAIAAWDEGHFYPILIDDVELTFKFLRAFQPARIVRSPRKAEPIPIDQLWNRARQAVARSWTKESDPPNSSLDGSSVPRSLGATPAGVVVSAPESPMLAGAVALAAGRYQPLLRWDLPRHYGDVLAIDEARKLALDLETRIADLIPRYGQLGDDCDFVTLAGDWPYRYNDTVGAEPSDPPIRFDFKGINSFDDLLGRSPDRRERWAYVGRLPGDARASVYRAMCSLFLQPRSALLFNTYAQKDRPWIDYSMASAARLLPELLRVTHRSGDGASLGGWHEVVDPMNRFGLVMMNTHGSPAEFNFSLPGGPAYASDLPPSQPTAVAMIHSFSCADPNNPQTLAGRWLANGAFVYYGSVNEPFLSAFRPPSFVAALIVEGLPLSVTLRQVPPDVFARPWRLTFLGDPLYRLESKRSRETPRLARWTPVDSWPAYNEFQQPGPTATANARLNWAIKESIFRLQRGAVSQQKVDMASFLLTIARASLEPALRPYHDALLIDALLFTDRQKELIERLALIPSADRSLQVELLLEHAQMRKLHRFVEAQDEALAQRLWEYVMREQYTREFQSQVTREVGLLAERTKHLDTWRVKLRARLRDVEKTPASEVIETELKRVDDLLSRK